MRILDCGGMPGDEKYVFLGDYVDRGKQSLETIMLLFCLKVKNPTKVILLRGNHESEAVNKFYGFFDECIKYLNFKNNR